MESIKNYAKARNISYEAARKQVKRYAAELEGHIRTQNRTQYLDNYAVELLDSHRQSSPIVIMQQDKDDELQQLRTENKALLQQVAALQDKLLTARENAVEAAKQTVMLEAAQADKDRLQARCEALEAELATARRHWWEKIFR